MDSIINIGIILTYVMVGVATLTTVLFGLKVYCPEVFSNPSTKNLIKALSLGVTGKSTVIVSLPVIAQKGTLPEDVLENERNGYFIKNANDLAEKIILLLNQPEKVKEMGIQSSKMVQKFSWNKVVKNIIEESKKI